MCRSQAEGGRRCTGSRAAAARVTSTYPDPAAHHAATDRDLTGAFAAIRDVSPTAHGMSHPLLSAVSAARHSDNPAGYASLIEARRDGMRRCLIHDGATPERADALIARLESEHTEYWDASQATAASRADR